MTHVPLYLLGLAALAVTLRIGSRSRWYCRWRTKPRYPVLAGKSPLDVISLPPTRRTG